MSSRKRGRRSDLAQDSDEEDGAPPSPQGENASDVPVQIRRRAAEEQSPGQAAAGFDEGADQGRLLQAVNQADQDRIMAGMIERIELTNFLVHSKFALDLHKHCNFIVGRNGSGKFMCLKFECCLAANLHAAGL